MTHLLGRRAELALRRQHVTRGHFVVLYGPNGVGKTALLDELEGHCRAANPAVGRTPRSETLADLTLALSRAYPQVRESTPRRTDARAVHYAFRPDAAALPAQ